MAHWKIIVAMPKVVSTANSSHFPVDPVLACAAGAAINVSTEGKNLVWPGGIIAVSQYVPIWDVGFDTALALGTIVNAGVGCVFKP